MGESMAGVRVPVQLTEVVVVAVLDTAVVDVGDAVALALRVTEGDGVEEGVMVDVGVWEAVTLALGVWVVEGEGEGVMVEVGEREAVALALGVWEGDTVLEALGVCVGAMPSHKMLQHHLF